MTTQDLKHLEFIHDRLVVVYKESSNTDFMIKLREIISNAEPNPKGENLATEALGKIANPIKYLQEEANKEGAKLDGMAAIILTQDVNFYQDIANKALLKIQFEAAGSTWIPLKDNEFLFNEEAKKNCLCKFEDGTIITYNEEHPMEIMTHFRITKRQPLDITPREKNVSKLTREKIINEIGISHEDDVLEILECIENDCMEMLRHDLFIKIADKGYDTNC